MYKTIFVMLDNSDYSLWALDRSIDMAGQFGAKLVGAHVYAAKLHEDRFVQMEPGLPAEYQAPEKLQEQRDIHGELIEKGLRIISDSYLDVFQSRCDAGKIPYSRKALEGRNYAELTKEIKSNGYDLVAMGARGLGEVATTQLGSVCERVTRRIDVDAMVMKKPVCLKGGHVVVGIDGSEQSFAAMKAAIALGKHMDCKVTAITVFDPDFHYKAFKTISKVLSKEAGEIFKFEQQEKLHEEIIDSGLEKIYRDHLETAIKMADDDAVKVEGHVLAGKPYDEILKWLSGKDVSLLILGKLGVHSNDDAGDLDIGSNTENLLRGAECNVMLVSRKVRPKRDSAEELDSPMEWTQEAIDLLEKVPGFVRNMVRGHMESVARKSGASKITARMVKEARKKAGM